MNSTYQDKAVSKWETGTSIPNYETLLSLSKLYNITINEILEPTAFKKINDFEQILEIDRAKLKTILESANMIEIVKASMGASPTVNKLLQEILTDVDFNKIRNEIGAVRITEIEDVPKSGGRISKRYAFRIVVKKSYKKLILQFKDIDLI